MNSSGILWRRSQSMRIHPGTSSVCNSCGRYGVNESLTPSVRSTSTSGLLCGMHGATRFIAPWRPTRSYSDISVMRRNDKRSYSASRKSGLRRTSLVGYRALRLGETSTHIRNFYLRTSVHGPRHQSELITLLLHQTWRQSLSPAQTSPILLTTSSATLETTGGRQGSP